jgi:putative ABC transport system substrate-binding protein
VRRREFITLVGGITTTWPLGARAQRQPAIPVVGFLRPTRAEESGHLVAALRQGLRESDYPSNKVVIEFRWADGREERLPKLASELVASQVTAIVAASLASARAAKAATASIPIIFVTGGDPQGEGLVSSLNHPGGNTTGVSFYDIPITGKRLALLRELVPKAQTIAILQDPTAATFQTESRELEAAVRASQQKTIILKATTEQEINEAFFDHSQVRCRCTARGWRSILQ